MIERTQIASCRGVDLPALRVTPNTPRSLIILVHGIFSSKEEDGRYLRLAEELGREGHATIAYDQQCHGESAECRTEMSVIDHVRDLNTVIKIAIAEHNQVSCVASSYGGAIALLLAQRSGGLPLTKIALLNPVTDFEAAFIKPVGAQLVSVLTEDVRTRLDQGDSVPLLNGITFADRFWTELKLLSPKKGLNLLPSALVLHGDADTAIDHDITKRDAVEASVPFRTIRGSDHAFTSPEVEREVFDTLIGFFND